MSEEGKLPRGSEKPVGLTKDTGWQVGARRTFPIRLDDAWDLITSTEGVRTWLGDLPELEWTVGAQYKLADGTRGEVRVFSPGSHLRITSHPPEWPRASTIQVRVIPSGDKTQISFHQEHLSGPAERQLRKQHFQAAHDTFDQMMLNS